MGESVKNLEQEGYDAWIELWVIHECSPTATMCPARFMKDDESRMTYIRGWNRAKHEHEST